MKKKQGSSGQQILVKINNRCPWQLKKIKIPGVIFGEWAGSAGLTLPRDKIET